MNYSKNRWVGLVQLFLPVVVFTLALDSSVAAISGVKPDQVFVADAKKNKSYVGNGVIVGGDWAIDDFTVAGIRRASNLGYERVVIDLEGNRGGEPAAVDRPPYYHVAVSPESKRVVVTIMGKPRLGFDPGKITSTFKRSSAVSKVELLPLVERDRWSFVMHLRKPSSVEVFELTKPTRIIVDLQAAKARSQPAEMTKEN
jgi:hypothetical protein